MNPLETKSYLIDFDEGGEAYLNGTPYDEYESLGWQDGWQEQYELQSRSYSQTRQQHNV